MATCCAATKPIGAAAGRQRRKRVAHMRREQGQAVVDAINSNEPLSPLRIHRFPLFSDMALGRLTNYVEQRIEQITALQTSTNNFNYKFYNCQDDINASLSCGHVVTCFPCGRNLARCPLCLDKLVSEPKRIVIPETISAAVARPYHLPPPGQPQISPIRSAMEYQAWPDVVLPFGIDPADRRLYPS